MYEFVYAYFCEHEMLFFITFKYLLFCALLLNSFIYPFRICSILTCCVRGFLAVLVFNGSHFV